MFEPASTRSAIRILSVPLALAAALAAAPAQAKTFVY